MPKPKTQDYYRLIASILSPVEDQIAPFHKQANWEHFVFYGSDHLVLPAIYCQIIRKGWSQYFPEELLTYLDALTEENRHRNRALLIQIKEIARLFNEAGIEYTFLKGCAMLAGGYYEDIGERMIGDIDILTGYSDSRNAFNCLKKNGYQKLESTILDHTIVFQNFKHRHLPRLIHSDQIGAVEVHTHLITRNKQKALNTIPFLENTQESRGIHIPSPSNLYLHSIYNWQFNDYGGIRLVLSFRAAYDVLLIVNKHSEIEASHTNDEAVRNFYAILAPFFSEVPQTQSIRQSFYLLKLDNPILGKFWDITAFGTVRFFLLLPGRLRLLFSYPKYRRRVLKILTGHRKE